MGCSRKDEWTSKKGISEDDLEGDYISYEEHKQNMKKIMKDMMEETGKDINEILDMPFSFFMEVVSDEYKSKPKKEQSLISAFGG